MLLTHSSTAKQEEKVKERGSCNPLAATWKIEVRMKIILLFSIIVSFASYLFADELKIENTFLISSITEIRNSHGSGSCLKKMDFDFTNTIEETFTKEGSVLNLENTSNYHCPTKPVVPQKNLHISLPGHYKIDEVFISNGMIEHSHTNTDLIASDKPLLTNGDITQDYSNEKDVTIYNSNQFYPNRWVDFTAGYDGFETQIYIHVFPVQWNPVSKEIYFLKEFEISIIGEPIVSLPIATSNMYHTESEHLILSIENWIELADSIAAFHNIPSSAINVDSIYSNYPMAEDPTEPGWAIYTNEDIHDYQYENAKHIISYLRDTGAHPNLEYITILGSAEIIPPSYYFSDYQNQNYESWMPSDQYYASPDYDWIDNYATTRIPVHDIEAGYNYLNKMRDFVETSSGAWTRNAIVSGGQPWQTKYYFGEMSNNQLICDNVFNGFSIQKFQEMRGNFYAEDVKNYWLNEDFLWYFNFSHGGGYDIVYADYTKITNEDVMEFPYKEKLPIIVDKGCWNGVYDTYLYEHPLFKGISLCETVISSPGAGIAYVAATRASYGQPMFNRIDGNIIPTRYTDDYAILYLFLREYRKMLNPTFGSLFKNAKSAFLKEYTMNGFTNMDPYLRFVVHADAALHLPIPPVLNSQTEVPIIFLQNGQSSQNSDIQYAGLTNETSPIYEISNEDNFELLTYSLDNKSIVSTDNNVLQEFSITGDVINQAIVNRLNNTEQKEVWHYSYLIRTAKTIDGQLDDWTEDEIICVDTKNEICDPLDLTDIYASYDEQTNSISFALPVEFEFPDSNSVRYYYSLVFDDSPGGFYNNYFEPGYFSDDYFIGFEHARINKVISLIISYSSYHPEDFYDLKYQRLTNNYHGGFEWSVEQLRPPYLNGLNALSENTLEFTISADSLNLENCRMAVISSKSQYGELYGIADDTIPSSVLSPSEPLYGIENAYSITDYINLGEILENSQHETIGKPKLYSSFPNPFNNETTIKFKISKSSIVEINIYNIKGQKVKGLNKELYDVGLHFVNWDGKNDNNRNLASGIYIIEVLVDGKNQQVKKCMLMK